MGDYAGMSLVVDMLVKSLVVKGRILDRVQFSTLRKMRSTYTKNWESLPYGVMEGAAFANGKYRVRQTSCPGSGKPRVPLGWDASQTQLMDYSLGPLYTYWH